MCFRSSKTNNSIFCKYRAWQTKKGIKERQKRAVKQGKNGRQKEAKKLQIKVKKVYAEYAENADNAAFFRVHTESARAKLTLFRTHIISLFWGFGVLITL